MSLFGLAVLALVALVAFAVALVAFRGCLTRIDRIGGVVGGTATPLPAVDEETDGHFVGSVAPGRSGASSPTLALATDTVGYWCLRTWANGAPSNAFTMLGRVLLRLRYGATDWRSSDDRRRAGVLLPDPLPVREGGERTVLTLGDGGYPLQRLEVDGGLVPYLLGAGFVVLAVAALFAPIVGLFLLPLVTGMPLALLASVVVVGLPPLAAAGLKAYHDTALLGGWETVAPPDDPAVPDVAAAAAAATDDPDGTARVSVRRLEREERLRVLGRVEPSDDGVELVSGVVTTRGRPFLAAASAVGAVKFLTAALVALAVGAGASWGVYVSI